MNGVFALIDDEPQVVQIAKEAVGRLRGEIAFDEVTFNYSTGRNTVLEEFNLTVPAGETLAIVGHTGAGKSSLVKLLMRFYEFQRGRLLIDGHNIRTLDLREYRRQLGLVPQVPFLFSGTVADNVRYGRLDASDEDVARAAQQLGDGSWLDGYPKASTPMWGARRATLARTAAIGRACARAAAKTQPSSYLMKPPPASIPSPKHRYRPRSLRCSVGGRASSSPIACRPCARRIGLLYYGMGRLLSRGIMMVY